MRLQFICQFPAIGIADELQKLIISKVIRQSVGTHDQPCAVLKFHGIVIRAQIRLGSQCPGYHIALRMLSCLLRGYLTHRHKLLHHRMIRRYLADTLLAAYICAAVACMDYMRSVPANDRKNHSSPHTLKSGYMKRNIIHCTVGIFNRQQHQVPQLLRSHFLPVTAAKRFGYIFSSDAACSAASVCSAHPVAYYCPYGTVRKLPAEAVILI